MHQHTRACGSTCAHRAICTFARTMHTSSGAGPEAEEPQPGEGQQGPRGAQGGRQQPAWMTGRDGAPGIIRGSVFPVSGKDTSRGQTPAAPALGSPHTPRPCRRDAGQVARKDQAHSRVQEAAGQPAVVTGAGHKKIEIKSHKRAPTSSPKSVGKSHLHQHCGRTLDVSV